MGKQLGRSRAARRGAAASGLLFALLGVACSSWDPEYLYAPVSGTGRVSFVDGGTLAVEADLELALEGSHVQSVALDGLCASVGSSWDQLHDVSIGEVEVDEEAWPVELGGSAGSRPVRRVRIRGTAAVPEDSPYHPCRSGNVMMQAAASLVSSEFGKVAADCRHGAIQTGVVLELVCPPCEDPFAPLGLAPDWEKTRQWYQWESPIENSVAVVDADGAVCRLKDGSVVCTRPDDEPYVELEPGLYQPDASGRVALAGGSLPGVVLAHATPVGYEVYDSNEEPPGEGGGGAGGDGGSGGSGGSGGGEPQGRWLRLRNFHLVRAFEGVPWVRVIEVQDDDFERESPVVAVAAGKVFVTVQAPRGLYLDGALVAEKLASGLFLAVFDEATGQLEGHVELAEPLVAAQGLPDGGFIAVAKSSAGVYALTRFDAGLQRSWTTPLPDEPHEGGAQGPELLVAELDGAYWPSPRGLLHRVEADGQLAWSVAPPWPITSMAIAPEGGLLITNGSSTLAWIDAEGVLRDTLGEPAYAFCSFGLLLASGGRQPAYLRTRQALSVGRLSAAP
jgi:hypothetical protein